jgi:hypothetical protein
MIRLIAHTPITLVFALLVGCKIQLIPPEGGKVTTASGNYACDSGQACNIDVRDTAFKEDFIATPDRGYAFLGWKKKPGGRRICGGKMGPCTINSSLAEGSDPLMDLLESEITFFLQPHFQQFRPSYLIEVAGTPQGTRIQIPMRKDVSPEYQRGWILPKTFDRGNDGYEDLLLVTGYYVPLGVTTTAEPAKQAITYFENNNGVFFDKTEDFFGKREVNYWARRIIFPDINKDGIPDIIFGSNNEDGRSFATNKDTLTSPLNLFLSTNTGSYKRSEIGYSIWTHDVSAADIDNDGIIEVVDAGFWIHSKHGKTPWNATYIYELHPDGNWNEDARYSAEANADRRIMSALEHDFHDYDGNGCLDLVSVAPHPASTEFVHYKNDCNGHFSQVDSFPLGAPMFTMPGKSWNGDEVEFLVAEINGEWVAEITIYWSTTLDVENDGDLDVIYAIVGFKVPEEDRQANYLDQPRSIEHKTQYQEFFLLRNDSGSFVRQDSPILEFPNGVKAYWSHSKDVNADGLIDLVFVDWDIRLKQAVYVNRGDGTFEPQPFLKQGQTSIAFPNIVPTDYNADGIMDYIAHFWLGQGTEDSDARLVLLEGLPAAID